MSTQLCGARYRRHRVTTCGKKVGHLEHDPLHKLDPSDPASMEWLDHDTEHPPAADRPAAPPTPPRTAEDVAAERRPIGWLFDQSRWSRG